MQTKFFVGTRLTPELKGQLGNQSIEKLQQVPFEGKHYVGCYLEATYPTLQEVRYLCQQLTTVLQKLCPQIRADTLPMVVFPQVFLG